MYDRLTTLLVTLVAAAGLNGCGKQVSYADVEPILQQKCAECHTGDKEGVVASGFSVDSYDTVMRGTKLGPVVEKGSAESSSLYRMVAGKTDPSIHMPHGRDPLSAEQIETIMLWIDQGAKK
jgi:hypothetical protein